MSMKTCCVAVLMASALSGSVQAQDEMMSRAKALFKPIPEQPPETASNPLTPDKVELGKMLFFDPRLSESHSISCNSCHNMGLAGVDVSETSLGHRWQLGARNSPTVFNAVFNTAQFWDGRAKDLKEQAGGPLVNPVEMDTTEEHVVEQLKGIGGYADSFKAAFPEQSDPITFAHVEDAIAAFESTLLTPNAPFDLYLKGDENALNDEQKAGLGLFMSKGCAGCHKGINVGGDMYAPFGVVEKPGADFLPPADKGRLAVTNTASDEYVFKVPSLRNIALTAPYFHSGRSWDLNQAVAVMGASQLGAKLETAEVDKITAFLHGLTGDQPQIVYPTLPPSTVDTPRPKP